jgi:rare lipoprotein A
MTLRLGGAICVAMAVFAYSSSSSTSIVKFGGAVHGTTAARVLLARAAVDHERKDPRIILKGSVAVPTVPVSSGAATPDATTGTAAPGAATPDATKDAATADVAPLEPATKSVVAPDASPSAVSPSAPPASAPVSGARTSGAAKIATAIARALSAGATITGVASTYNPFRATDTTAGGIETASGERYNPAAWTAAIQTDLRDQFGGVRYGKDYRPCYALIVKGNKQAIIKINDVGPLEPGRVIDLNEQTMRYFDPSFELGLLGHVAVTPLVGDGWLTGPVAANSAIAAND